MTTLDFLRDDIQILVSRMLRTDDALFMFGEDGCGQHGQNSQVFRGQVGLYDVACSADDDEDPSDIHCLLKLYVVGYDARVLGHAITDKNLEICLNQMFVREAYDIDSWDWAHISMQGDDYIALNLDVAKLLDWA
jgi:hypothetical protein